MEQAARRKLSIESQELNEPARQHTTVYALDVPGEGNACHKYAVLKPNPSGPGEVQLSRIHFQNGPIAESGLNGVTNENLIAIVIDRLQGFQSGPYPSEYNQHALEHLLQALGYLEARTLDRIQRGVEGKNEE